MTERLFLRGQFACVQMDQQSHIIPVYGRDAEFCSPQSYWVSGARLTMVFPRTLQAALSVLSLSLPSVHMGPVSLANLIPLDRIGATRPREETGPHGSKTP